MFPRNLIISSYKLYEYCKERYPNRLVEASPYPNYKDFYYFNRHTGEVRIIRNKNEVWVLGNEFPLIQRRR